MDNPINNTRSTRNILKLLATGKVKLDDLKPAQVYLFMTSNKNPGVYKLENTGEEYTEIQYKEFCEKIEQRKNGSFIWNESRQYENVVLSFEPTVMSNSN